MANFRTIVLWLFISVIFCSCKAPASIFSYSKHINADFFRNVVDISANSGCLPDSAIGVQVYRATNACIYVPVKYGTGNGDCIGFGSAYFGCINKRLGTIDFFSEIKVRKKGESFSLVKMKPVYMTFFPDKIPEPGIEFLDITKIVFENLNKFGGPKPVVFNTADVFHDPLALRFNYRETISLKTP